MLSFYKGTIPIINDDPQTHAMAFPLQDADGKRVSYGAEPRDFTKYPMEMFDGPGQMQVTPKSEWDARYDEQEAQKSSLEHIFLSGPGGQPRFVNLDQNGQGFCWAYSTGHALMMARLAKNLPLVRLNPHATASIINGGRDGGGWCGASAKFARENGYAEEGNGPGQWPLHYVGLKYDTPELRASMAHYKSTEEWVDLTRDVYDVNMSELQAATALFQNLPSPSDFPWWSHSVLTIRWVRIEAGSWGRLILNSWKGWGRFGLGVLQGSKAVAGSTLAIRSVVAA